MKFKILDRVKTSDKAADHVWVKEGVIVYHSVVSGRWQVVGPDSSVGWFTDEELTLDEENVHIALFNEGDFEEIETVKGKRYAAGYCSGFNSGSGKYGGSGSAYVLPDDEETMREDESAEAVEDAMRAWEEAKKKEAKA